MKKTLIIVAVLIVALVSFGFLFMRNTPADYLDRKEYIEWIENEQHEFRRTVQTDNLLYEVTLCTPEYIIAKEFRSSVIEKQSFKKRLTELAGLQYFKLRIKLTKSNSDVLAYNLEGGQQGYYQRVDYLSYGVDENLKLIQNSRTDTLRPALYHMERTYGVAPFIDFLVAFPLDSVGTDPHKVFMYNDLVFGSGVVRFDFNTDKIKNSPKLLVK